MDSLKLRSIYLNYNQQSNYSYIPVYPASGHLSYLAAAVATNTGIWSMLRRAAGHVESIAPDLFGISIGQGSYTMAIMWQRDECLPASSGTGAVTMQYRQAVASCIIYTNRDTSIRALRAKNIGNALYLNDRAVPDSLYQKAGFLPEAARCNNTFPTVRNVGILEGTVADLEEEELYRFIQRAKVTMRENREIEIDGSTSRFSESEINTDAYTMLKKGDSDVAEALADLNATVFPDSYNAHDSYGEILLYNGRVLAALSEYNMALELNKRNSFKTRSRYYTTAAMKKLIQGR